MKGFIESNYNVKVENPIDKNGVYTFTYNKDNYLLLTYNRSPKELNDIINCCLELESFNIDTLKFVLNKHNVVLTQKENLNYILFKVFNNYNQIVDLDNIIENNKKLYITNSYKSLYRNNWAQLWSKKLDYYEYQIHELGKDKSVILDSYGYYSGLATNAIQLVNNSQKLFNKDLDKITLSHRRIFYPNYKLNYYNPISFVFDLEIRDVAEYIKSIFFSDGDALLDLSTYLKCSKLTKYSYQMLYARLLFPSYYFDIYDKIMNEDEDQDKLVNIIKKVDKYEIFLKKAYLEITKYANIEKIEWISMIKEY